MSQANCGGDESFVPASTIAVSRMIGRERSPECRLRFDPFGPPRVGVPGKGENRILYAEAYLSHKFRDGFRPTIWFDANGIKYVLTDGEQFTVEDPELWEEAFGVADLGDCGRVLGRASPTGDGFVPVGVDVEIAVRE